MSLKFAAGDRVKLGRELKMAGGFKLAAGMGGTVTAVHFQTSVLFDGVDQPLQLADSDLHPLVGDDATNPTRVRLLVNKQFGSQLIPAGSLGTVTQLAPTMNASWVVFDGLSEDKLIPNGDLAPA